MTDLEAIARGLTKAQGEVVPGYEGRYEIDRLGRVFSLERHFIRNGHKVKVPARNIAITHSRKGYPQVTLFRDGKGKTFELHRLVCRVYHGDPEASLEAAHLDGNKNNPSADNLAWVSRSENHSHKWQHGTMQTGETVVNSKLKLNQVHEIIHRHHMGESKRSIARSYGVSEKTVRLIISGKMWASYTSAVRDHLNKEKSNEHS